MVAFVRFVMRDNGLPIHINVDLVTQVRQTVEGEPAIYVSGRDTPMLVEGTLEAIMQRLDSAATGLFVAEPYVEPEPVTAEVIATESEPEAPATTTLEPEIKAPPKGKTRAKTKAKRPGKAVAQAAPDAPLEPEAANEPETLYPEAAWFRGSR